MDIFNNHTKDKGGEEEDEGVEELAEDGVREEASTKGWHMDPSPQLKPINKDTEVLQTKPTNKGMEEGEAPHNARTASISTIGTCVFRVVLMYRTGTQARLAPRMPQVGPPRRM